MHDFIKYYVSSPEERATNCKITRCVLPCSLDDLGWNGTKRDDHSESSISCL